MAAVDDLLARMASLQLASPAPAVNVLSATRAHSLYASAARVKHTSNDSAMSPGGINVSGPSPRSTLRKYVLTRTPPPVRIYYHYFYYYFCLWYLAK